MRIQGDAYSVKKDDVYLLLKDAKKYRIQLHHLSSSNLDEYEFICFYWHRKKIHQHLPYIKYEYSIGLFHFISLYFLKKYRLIGLISGVCCFYFLNQLTYGCLIDNTYPTIKNKLELLCHEFQLDELHFILPEEKILEIEKQIKDKLSNEIDYFDIFLDENIYKITYTKKLNSKLTEQSYTPLIASHDAVVDKIDIQSGNVLVERGQYVSKGQMIVSNEIQTTSEDIEFVSVEGKIYGFVYHTFEASTKGALHPDNYTLLYQKISRMVNEEIGDDGYIVQENVLQYTQKEGKIVLRIQFTLYQNIAKKEFLNEE